MNEKDFTEMINKAFIPFLKDLGFIMDSQNISGKFYKVSFSDSTHKVNIAYEPSEKERLFVVIFRINSPLSEFDNRSKSPSLSNLNSLFMNQISTDQRVLNDEYFKNIEIKDEDGKLMLKTAKELRLVLPKYLDSLKLK